MGILKYILIAVAIIWLLYSPALRGRRVASSNKPSGNIPPRKTESMVACAHCGVHFPAGDALKDDQGRTYCNASHRQAGPARA